MSTSAPADWYPDPYGRYELRYWDGAQWTAHVATGGSQGVESQLVPPPAPARAQPNTRIQQQLARSGVVGSQHEFDDALLSQRVLVVNQKAKLFESRAEYAVFDRNGNQVGAVRELRRSILKKAMSARPDDDQTRRLQIVDANGTLIMSLLRPAKVYKSTMIVSSADGSPIGKIIQKTVGLIGKVRFDIVIGGNVIGAVSADGWDAWDFGITDASGNEVARVSKDWAGARKELFTKSDNYVLQIHYGLQDPLRSLVIATALAIDTALYQGSSNARTKRRRIRLL